MSEEAVRYGATKQTCFVVTRYIPKRTRKGHWVWCRDRDVTVLPLTLEEARQQFPGIELKSHHNTKLTPSECVRFLASSPQAFAEGSEEDETDENSDSAEGMLGIGEI